MIDNKNPNNFYSPSEMKLRKESIPKDKKAIREKLLDLMDKIDNEVPFPYGNQSVDTLGGVKDELDNLLDKWN